MEKTTGAEPAVAAAALPSKQVSSAGTYPRKPAPSEDLVGKVCVCSVGRPAIVVAYDSVSLGGSRHVSGWVGLGLDGRGTWFSTSPAVLEDDPRAFHDKLLARFGGKMSANG